MSDVGDATWTSSSTSHPFCPSHSSLVVAGPFSFSESVGVHVGTMVGTFSDTGGEEQKAFEGGEAGRGEAGGGEDGGGGEAGGGGDASGDALPRSLMSISASQSASTCAAPALLVGTAESSDAMSTRFSSSAG